MINSRQNNIPEFGEYISRARQAIELGLLDDEESSDKQAGDGVVGVPVENLQSSLEIVKELKEKALKGDIDVNTLNRLEETLSSINSDI